MHGMGRHDRWRRVSALEVLIPHTRMKTKSLASSQKQDFDVFELCQELDTNCKLDTNSGKKHDTKKMTLIVNMKLIAEIAVMSSTVVMPFII